MGDFFTSMQRLDDHQYKMEHQIGEGGCGRVYKALDFLTNSYVAVKRIEFVERVNGLPSVVLREISVLKVLKHVNVVRLLDVKMILNNDFVLILECLDYDLHWLMNTISEPLRALLVKGFLFQILQGLSYCHSQKVIHRDLKPRNVLIDQATKTVKLADFGFARTFEVSHSQNSAEVVTRAYKAPELLLRIPYTTAVDIWSAGCLFAEMVNGNPLFYGNNRADCMTKIIRTFGVPSETDWPGVTSSCLRCCRLAKLPSDPTPNLADIVPNLEPEGLDLLSKMLCMVPSRRISAYDALRHPYFKDVDLSFPEID